MSDKVLTDDRPALEADRSPRPERSKLEKSGSRSPAFVIQKHAASSIHFDFRIEVDGVLKCWAVPYGPSPDPKIKRLAVATEDQPLEMAEFEGEVLQGVHGGAAIVIWDAGTYQNLTVKDGRRLTPGEALEEGRFLLRLRGRKVRGDWSLQRTGRGKKSNWLLIRLQPEGTPARRVPADNGEAT